MSAAAASPTAASLYNDRAPARIPLSAVGSLCLHGAILGLWLYTLKHTAEKVTHNITGVDIITVKKAVPLPEQKQVAQAKPAVSAFDFLKMALPAAPHMAAPQMAKINLPETHKAMTVEQPKLHDRGHLDTGPKLDMDLEHHDNLDVAKVAARIPQRKLAAIANAPKLEDIGRRRVANLPQALAMEERRQEAQGLQGMNALAKATSRGHVAAQPDTIQDAAPEGKPASSFGQKIASLLPERTLDMNNARVPVQVRQGVVPSVEEAPHQRQKAKLQTGDSGKKGVEIEGPLADRKVVNYEIPEFPQWAKDQGILEASVAIRFWVNKDGEVLPNMRIEHTSGYGRLDRLAMDSLSRWKFAPLLSDEKQWGVITFRFLLE